MSLASRRLATLVAAGLLTALAPVPTSVAATTTLCSGWSGCRSAGYSDAGYGAASGTSWWRMYGGHNCTNYVAYRMVQAGMSTERPFSGTGNAWNWGVQMADRTDQNPTVGAVAWWNKNVSGAGSVGHVAYVEQVVSPTEIVVSEDSWGGDFHWRRITKGSGWPSGFIHLVDKPIVNTAPVGISGTPAVGQVLSAVPGTWSPAAATTFQWFLDGVPIAGATASTLKLTAAHGGRAVSLRVTASQAGFSTATSDTAALPVSLGQLSPAAAPPVTGVAKVAKVGTVLTAGETTFAPAARSLAVQWQADGAPIAGATGWTYTLAASDVGKQVTAVVVGRRPGFSDTPASSAVVGPVVAGRVKVAAPYAVRGRALVGRTMKVTGGAVDPADATAAYTWLRDGSAISGANGATYTLTPADAGSRISVALRIGRDGWLPRRTTVDRAATVSTTPTVVVRTASRKGRTVVWFRVDAPGVAQPAGPAKVTVGGLERGVTVRRGKGRLVLRGLAPGKRQVDVTWLGTDTIRPASASDVVRVRR